jgi:hypothetical protein
MRSRAGFELLYIPRHLIDKITRVFSWLTRGEAGEQKKAVFGL